MPLGVDADKVRTTVRGDQVVRYCERAIAYVVAAPGTAIGGGYVTQVSVGAVQKAAVLESWYEYGKEVASV